MKRSTVLYTCNNTGMHNVKHAIEYGYSAIEVEMEQPGRQPPQLQAIAARGASRHELAFATDEDGPRSDGADPFTVSCASGGTGRSASV